MHTCDNVCQTHELTHDWTCEYMFWISESLQLEDSYMGTYCTESHTIRRREQTLQFTDGLFTVLSILHTLSYYIFIITLEGRWKVRLKRY